MKEFAFNMQELATKKHSKNQSFLVGQSNEEVKEKLREILDKLRAKQQSKLEKIPQENKTE